MLQRAKIETIIAHVDGRKSVAVDIVGDHLGPENYYRIWCPPGFFDGRKHRPFWTGGKFYGPNCGRDLTDKEIEVFVTPDLPKNGEEGIEVKEHWTD